MIKKERKLHRLQGYDYSKDNHYFVTICTHNREHFFGAIKNNEMILNEYGNIVENQWLWLQKQYEFVFLDEFIVMPNHFHGILIINSSFSKDFRNITVGNSRDCSSPKPKIKSLSQLIGAFKTTSSKLIHHFSAEKLALMEKSPHECMESPQNCREQSRLFTTANTIFQWQKSFHDRIIRNERELNNVRNYIKNNPLKWSYDIENATEDINETKNTSYYEKIISVL